jgi:HSP20 family protein
MTDKQLQKQETVKPAEIEKSRHWLACVPAVDIRETDDAFVLDVNLPGIRPEDVSIEYRDDILSLSAERTCNEDSGKRLVSEFDSCGYERRFTISAPVNEDAITADYRQGVLHLVLPKAESVKPRKIEISAE